MLNLFILNFFISFYILTAPFLRLMPGDNTDNIDVDNEENSVARIGTFREFGNENSNIAFASVNMRNLEKIHSLIVCHRELISVPPECGTRAL